jgi:hypothetical protein
MKLLLHWVRNQHISTVLLCLPLALLYQWAIRTERLSQETLEIRRWMLIPMALFILFAFAGPLLFVTHEHMLFHDEPAVIAVAAAELHGEPLYHAPAAAERYSLLYGPATYWVYMPPMIAKATDLRIFQLWVLLPLSLSALVAWHISRRLLSPRDALFTLFCFAVAVLTQSPSEWAMKADVWILLAICVALWGATKLGKFGAPIVIGLSGALLINLKITAIVPLCVPLLLLQKRFGYKSVLATLSIVLGLVLGTFSIPGISWHNYWFWLHASTVHRLSSVIMLDNTSFMAFLALPALALYAVLYVVHPQEARLWLRTNLTLLAVIVICAIFAIVTGSKVGAGNWHCMPLAPIMLALSVELLARLRSTQSALNGTVPPRAVFVMLWLFVSLLVVAANTSLWTFKLHINGGTVASGIAPRAAANDLRTILTNNPGRTIQMGYGNNATYDLTFQRPILVLNGNPYTLDADAMAEMGLSDLPLPQATVDAMRSCAIDIWLIPRDAAPFSMASLYFMSGEKAPRDVFPHQLREAFLSNYRKSSQSRFYDSWTCSHPSP